MAIKEQFVDLVLRAKNLISPDTKTAAASVDELADSAEGLQDQLAALEDQKALIGQFGQASKAVDSASKAYDRAQDKAAKLAQKMDDAGVAVFRQKAEFEKAEKSVADAAGRYEEAQAHAARLAEEIDHSGVATQKQAKEFERSQKAVDRAASAYEKAVGNTEKLGNKIADTEVHIARQAEEFDKAQAAVDSAEREYEKAGNTMEALAKEAQAAGIDVTDLSGAQRENAKQTAAASRALDGYNDELEDGESRLGKFSNGLVKSIARLAAWGAAATAAAAAAGVAVLTRMTAGQADLARELLATSKALGISTNALQEWWYAAKTVGLEGDKVSDIFKDLSEKLGDAFLTGGGEAADVIERLGLNLEELVRLSPDKALERIAAQLDKLGDEDNKVFVLESLASDASLLLPLLNSNAASLKRLQEQARQRGVLVSEDDLAKLKATNDAFRQIGDRLTEFKNKLAADLAPTLTSVANDFEEFLASNPALINDVSEALSGLIVNARNWVNTILDNRAEIADSFQTIANTARFLGSSFEALFRGTQAFAAGTLEVLTRIGVSASDLYLTVVSGLNKIGLATDDTVRGAQERVQNLSASVEDLESRVENYKAQMVNAGKAALTAFDQTAAGAKTAGDLVASAAAAANELVNANSDLADSAEGAAQNTEKLQASQQQLAQQISETVKAIEAATLAWQQDSTEENLNNLDALKQKYGELQEELRSLEASVGSPQDSSLVKTFQESSDAIDEVSNAAKRAKGDLETMGDDVEVVAVGVRRAGDDAVSSASSTAASIGGIFGEWTQRIAALSEQASVYFRRALGFKDAASEAGTLQDRLDAIGDKLSAIGNGFSNSRITDVLNDWARAGLETERTFISQQIAVEKLTQKILSGSGAVDVMSLSADDLERRFSLLDRQQLSGLLGAVQSVQREVDGLKDSLDDTISASRQELAALRGDTAEVENLRYRERELELQEQLSKARALGDKVAIDKAQEALNLAEEAYDLRQKQAKEQAEDSRRQAAEQAAEAERRRQISESEERQDISRSESQVRQQNVTSFTTRVVKVQFVAPDGSGLGEINAFDDRLLDGFLDALENGRLVTTR